MERRTCSITQGIESVEGSTYVACALTSITTRTNELEVASMLLQDTQGALSVLKERKTEDEAAIKIVHWTMSDIPGHSLEEQLAVARKVCS